MKTLVIDNKYDGKKLNTVLLKEFPHLSINVVYKALRKKDIRVNDSKVNENVLLHYGDKLKIFISDDILFGISENQNKLEKSFLQNFIKKVYEDENIIVLNKPAGIEVTSSSKSTSPSLESILNSQYSSPVFPCHRLDRNTTGLIIFAKNNESLQILFDKFKTHQIEKKYLCKVYGIPKEEHKVLNDYLFKDNKKSTVYISSVQKKGYVPITTEYIVKHVDKINNTSILEVILHTR